MDKYLSLARDAASSGDPVSAENYYQYADHYYRLALANRIPRIPPSRLEKHDDPGTNTSESLETPTLTHPSTPL